jgi:hypothetical protein
LLIWATHFLGGCAHAQTPFGNQDAVGDRQFRRAQPVEDELGLDRPLAHRRERRLPRRDKNSSSA